MNNEHNNNSDEYTNNLLDQICEGVEVGEDKDYSDWSHEGNTVEYKGALHEILEIEMEMVSNGEDAFTGDDPYAYTLKNLETGEASYYTVEELNSEEA